MDFPASKFLYKLLPLFDGLCHTPLPTFFLSSTVSESVHDEVQGLIVTARSLFGDRRSTFGFDALPFVGVVFFLSSSLMGVVLVPTPAH